MHFPKIALLAAALLVACNQPNASSAQSAPATAAPAQAGSKPAIGTVAQSPTPAAAPGSNAGLTSAMLYGRWGDNGDCAKDIVFAPDGTFRSYTGGGGAWSLSGDVVTMSGAGGTFSVRVQILNGQTLLVTNPDGSVGTSQRC